MSIYSTAKPNTPSTPAATATSVGKEIPPHISAGIHGKQRAALKAAIQSGPRELLKFAQKQQEERDQRTTATWNQYTLPTVYPGKYPNGVITPGYTTFYQGWAKEDGTYHCTCDDHAFVAEVNAALHGAGLAYRLYCKHAGIYHKLLSEQGKREIRERMSVSLTPANLGVGGRCF